VKTTIHHWLGSRCQIATPAAERRDRASEDRELAADDREEAAKDRAHAARDRELASLDLANEGIDSLTGVLGRRVGLTALQREIGRAERSGESLVVGFVDAVGLKARLMTPKVTQREIAPFKMLWAVSGTICVPMSFSIEQISHAWCRVTTN
jgi:hypothetical protein